MQFHIYMLYMCEQSVCVCVRTVLFIVDLEVVYQSTPLPSKNNEKKRIQINRGKE